jgi:hypothetical protein
VDSSPLTEEERELAQKCADRLLGKRKTKNANGMVEAFNDGIPPLEGNRYSGGQYGD